MITSLIALVRHLVKAMTFRHDGADLPRAWDINAISMAGLVVASSLARYHLVGHEPDPDQTLISALVFILMTRAVLPAHVAVVAYLVWLGTDILAIGLALMGLDTASTTMSLPNFLVLVYSLIATVVAMRKCAMRDGKR